MGVPAYQFVLVGPLLAPIWLIGLWRLARDPALRTWRAFALAWVLLAVAFIATSAKPYYLAGLFPLLLAAGTPTVLGWARATQVRAGLLAAALILTALVNAVLMLPLVPADRLAATPIPAINYDAAETVRLAGVRHNHRVGARAPARRPRRRCSPNYGEAGPSTTTCPPSAPAHSGHNAYWDWARPPTTPPALIVIGYPEEQLARWFGRVELATTSTTTSAWTTTSRAPRIDRPAPSHL